MPLVFVIAAGTGDVEQDAAETGLSEIVLHIDLRSFRGRGVGRSLHPALRDQMERRSNSKRQSAKQPSWKQFDFNFHNHVLCCVYISFSRVSRFAHPETGRDFAAKAANYFEKSARDAFNAKAQRRKESESQEQNCRKKAQKTQKDFVAGRLRKRGELSTLSVLFCASLRPILRSPILLLRAFASLRY